MVVFDRIMLFLTILAEVYMLWDYFGYFFEVRTQLGKKGALGIMAGTILCIFAVNMMGSSYINLILMPVIYFVFSLMLFQIPLVSRIIYVFVAWLVLLSGEFIFTLILGITSYFVKVSSVTNLAEMTWFVFAMKLISYIIFAIIKQMSKKGNSRYKMPTKIFIMYICQPVVSIVVLMATYYSNNNVEITSQYKVIMTLTFAIMLAANILIFFAFNQSVMQMSINMEQKIELLRHEADVEYYKLVAQRNEEHRKFIHDANNYFKAIGELARMGDKDKIIELAKECTSAVMQQSGGRIYCDHSVVNAVINEKARVAKAEAIRLDINIKAGRQLMDNIADIDIVCILGNLLDNAIRAAKSCGDKAYIELDISTENEGRGVSIIIKNPYKEAIIPSGKGFITTKTDKDVHGMGINNVREAVERYKGLFECIAEDNEFRAFVNIEF